MSCRVVWLQRHQDPDQHPATHSHQNTQDLGAAQSHQGRAQRDEVGVLLHSSTPLHSTPLHSVLYEWYIDSFFLSFHLSRPFSYSVSFFFWLVFTAKAKSCTCCLILFRPKTSLVDLGEWSGVTCSYSDLVFLACWLVMIDILVTRSNCVLLHRYTDQVRIWGFLFFSPFLLQMHSRLASPRLASPTNLTVPC